MFVLKNKYLILSLIIPVMIILPLAGCSRSDASIPPVLEELIAKANSINEMSYEVVISATNTQTLMKIWVKGSMLRAESDLTGRHTVILADMEKNTGYEYIPDGNIAVKLDLSKVPDTIKDNTESLRKRNPSIIGTEVLDGKSCTVVSYREGQTSGTVWIWNDYGLAIKSEAHAPDGDAVVEIKNIDFSNIPDNVFELPDEVLRSDWFDTAATGT